MGGPLYVINVSPPDNLKNERTYSIEAGYKGKLTEHITLNADAYYQRFDRLIGYRKTINMLGQIFAVPDNIDGGDSWGTEVELAIEKKNGRVSLWYALNNFDADQSSQDISAFLPAKHKAGINARLFLPEGWTANANYKFTNTTPGNPATGNNDLGASNRLDITVSKVLEKNKTEVMLGVSDLFNKENDPVRESNLYTGHKVPGRTFFVNLVLRF